MRVLLYIDIMKATDIIKHLNLTPLPVEGGYFRRTYLKSDESPSGTSASAIFYFLTPDTCSLLHRLPKDELYHFYVGDPVELLVLDDHGGRRHILGSDILGGQKVQHLVPAGFWQGSRLVSGGRFALMGTTMCPAFADEDLEMIRPDNFIATNYSGDLQELIRALSGEH